MDEDSNSADGTDNTSGLVHGRITPESVALMRERIGFPSPTVRAGILTEPYNIECTCDAIRRYAIGAGDDNPLYRDPGYAAGTRWGGCVAPPCFEMSTGLDRSREMDLDFAKRTSKALRGVHLFHSGGEHVYYRPVGHGTKLYKSGWVADVEEKKSSFGNKSVLVTNGHCWWDENDVVHTDGVDWFIHTERQQASDKSSQSSAAAASYSDSDMAEIEAAYDAEFQRGAETLYLEDVTVGETTPTMVKGPLTITDLINTHMAAGWFGYGNPPYKLAYENRKKLRGFYTKNEFGAWDTLQRIHWDEAMASKIGVPATYDIGPMRRIMAAHYATNFAGDDGWVHRLKYEFRKFNYMGDTTWIRGSVTDARDDPQLGPLVEIEFAGTNQRGEENLRGGATILVASKSKGLARLPEPPPVTPYRS